MTIHLSRGEAAMALLTDPSFRQKWQELLLQCPWATPFQSHAFVATWYEIYAPRYEPLLVAAFTNDQLTGLLTLALERATGDLVFAGTHHAEYTVWLSRAQDGDEFIVAAIASLRTNFPTQSLLFKYLPPNTPLAWLTSALLPDCHLDLQPRVRPLMRLGDGSHLTESLRKKSNKSRLNRLRQQGEPRFVQITEPAALEAIFDEAIAYTDLRQGAVHDVLPFRLDPLKKPFHLALMQHPELVHVTALMVGEMVAALHFGIRSADEVSLWLFAHSPFLAAHSPGKFHLFMLGEMLAQQGFATFDLTPGDDEWKERFATTHDQVHTLRVTFDSGSRQLKTQQAQRRFEAFAKRGFQAIGISPQQVRSLIGKLRRVKPSSLPKKLLKKVWNRTEFRVYVYAPEDVRKLPRPQVMSRDSLPALLAFEPMAEHQTRQGFLARALHQLETEQHCYTLVENDCLVHYGWLGLRQQRAKLSEVGQEFIYEEPENAVLYDFFTHPQARGRGLYQQALYQILHDAAAVPGIRKIYIMVLADNGPSRHVIEKVGFTYQGSLFRQKRWGKTTNWTTNEQASN
ncbi:MAG TPA: GNAT family N-acetyltransferase [Blastocatellia bacterium]|nr:GNAT family N-acetyltransferase [Blastocatellia bacterium]